MGGGLIYLLLEHGKPIDVVEPVVIFDVVDPVDEVAIATREVLMDHVLEQVAKVTREELGKLELQTRTSETCILTLRNSRAGQSKIR